MNQSAKVAVVRSHDRRDAVVRALELLGDDLVAAVRPDVLVKPNLVSHKKQLPSTHVDVIHATLDALFTLGARHVTIAEGASDATAGFTRFGYQQAVDGRPVTFFDINKKESDWEPLELSAIDGSPLVARVSRTIAQAPCRVSLALAKTHVTSILTLSLKNMLSSIHPDDRVMMHGHPGGGNGYQGWKKYAVEFLKGDSLAVNVLTRTMGRIKNVRNARNRARQTGDPFVALTPSELGFLRSVEAMNRNLVALSRKVRPHVSVVDGFIGMHREGPRHGTPIRLGTVVAGTNAVAVDAVAASVMEFNPREIGYLHHADAAGLGPIDPEHIEVIGDPIASVRRTCVPHSNDDVQRHWYRLAELTRRGPHFAVTSRSDSGERVSG